MLNSSLPSTDQEAQDVSKDFWENVGELQDPGVLSSIRMRAPERAPDEGVREYVISPE